MKVRDIITLIPSNVTINLCDSCGFIGEVTNRTDSKILDLEVASIFGINGNDEESVIGIEIASEKSNAVLYQTSKLAREIASYLDLNRIAVWDALNELEFEAQELTHGDVMKWTSRVEKAIFNLD